MNLELLNIIRSGRLIILLGAGASKDCLDQKGEFLLDGDQLAKAIADKCGLTYKSEPLGIVYSSALRRLGTPQLTQFIEENFENCKASDAYNALSKYPWPRIYTLNIDDALQNALRNHSPQTIKIRHWKDPVEDQDQLFQRLDYIKLNGSAERANDGLIFSPQEYGKASANKLAWYEELANDYFNSLLSR